MSVLFVKPSMFSLWHGHLGRDFTGWKPVARGFYWMKIQYLCDQPGQF
jgi:hypothetical protein